MPPRDVQKGAARGFPRAAPSSLTLSPCASQEPRRAWRSGWPSCPSINSYWVHRTLVPYVWRQVASNRTDGAKLHETL